ncbi:uncharacterized protein [Musca autumnalis]|uniref:uncharacterized protein n=1 Tax=Musca autumnalis TaxID=221902 RepID=UPI003CF69DEE
MSSEQEQANPSKGKMKYFSPQANPNCSNCQEVSRKLDTVLEILAEHKVASQNAFVNNIMSIFPIKSEEKLRELDNLLATQADPYIKVISAYNESPDKTLRSAFQRQKKKYFKQNSRSQPKIKQNDENNEQL